MLFDFHTKIVAQQASCGNTPQEPFGVRRFIAAFCGGGSTENAPGTKAAMNRRTPKYR